jgi:hypothetical protein
MNDLNFKMLLARAYVFSGLTVVLLLSRLLWNFWDPINWGLILGTAAGICNGILLGRRLCALTGADRNRWQVLLGGPGMRLMVVFGVLYLAWRVPWISVAATGVGLFVMPVVFLLVALGEMAREGRRIRQAS